MRDGPCMEKIDQLQNRDLRGVSVRDFIIASNFIEASKNCYLLNFITKEIFLTLNELFTIKNKNLSL